ncbi:MAG: hypothetical protein ACUVTZ_06240 [Armatimonadota bacterium]
MTVLMNPLLFFALTAGSVAVFAVCVSLALLRALARERARRELTPADLKALESAAAAILDEIRLATDDAVSRIRQQIEEARALCCTLENLCRDFTVEANGRRQDRPCDCTDSCASLVEQIAEGPAGRARALADSGLNPQEIAREMGIGIGEVELLLGVSARTGAAT